MCGFICDNCGHGRVNETVYDEYPAKINDTHIVVAKAVIGVCDECGTEYFIPDEVRKWLDEYFKKVTIPTDRKEYCNYLRKGIVKLLMQEHDDRRLIKGTFFDDIRIRSYARLLEFIGVRRHSELDFPLDIYFEHYPDDNKYKVIFSTDTSAKDIIGESTQSVHLPNANVLYIYYNLSPEVIVEVLKNVYVEETPLFVYPVNFGVFSPQEIDNIVLKAKKKIKQWRTENALKEQ